MKIFVDLDGVLADFTSKALELSGLDPKDPNLRKFIKEKGEPYANSEYISKKQYWKNINKLGEGFWSTLEPLPWAFDLHKLCCDLVGNDNVFFLTSPGLQPESASGKIRWIQNHFGWNNRNYVIAPHKGVCGGTRSLLIDDSEKKIQQFADARGWTLHFPHQFLIEDGDIDIETVYDQIRKWVVFQW